MKKEYNIYFLNTLASGLFYSFITTKILSMNFPNIFIIIILSSIVDVLILGDLRGAKIIEKIKIKYYPLIGLLITILLFFLSESVESVYLYLISYFFVWLILAILALVFETLILKQSDELKKGFFNIGLIRTFAKLIGFFIGNVLAQLEGISTFLYIFVLLIMINICITWKYDTKIAQENEKRESKILEKHFYLILGILGTATVLWIPMLTKDFLQSQMASFSWIAFVLPGVAIMIFLSLQKRYPLLIKPLIIECGFIALFFVFSVLRLLNLSIVVQVVVFSLLSAFNLSLSIKINKRFLEVNSKKNMKYILKTIGFSSSVVTLSFSFFNNHSGIIQGVLVISCMASAFYMIIKRSEFT